MVGPRDVIRTMYPPVLADRGLRGALAGLGARSPVPATVEAVDLDDVPAPVEAAVYFVVAEALANVVKHSGAAHSATRACRRPARHAASVPACRCSCSASTSRRSTPPSCSPTGPAASTPREREVLALMAQGQANNEIASRLVVTDSAVHKHIGNIFEKLELPASDGSRVRTAAAGPGRWCR